MVMLAASTAASSVERPRAGPSWAHLPLERSSRHTPTEDATSSFPGRPSVEGTYLDEVLMMRNAAGTKYYYHTNHLYSVHAITNAAGAIVEAVGSYDAYGKPTILTGAGTDATWFTGDDVVGSVSAIGNPWFYTGQRLDAETGLMYYKNRYYSAELGRFVGRDPIGYRGGINLFTFVFSSPSFGVDPLGLRYVCIYRGDSRCPDWSPRGSTKTLKESGFVPWSETRNVKPNEDIWAHVTDASPSARDTPYTSWSKSWEVAAWFAIENAKWNNDCRGCIYWLCYDDEEEEIAKRAKTPREWAKEQGTSDKAPEDASWNKEIEKNEREVTVKGTVRWDMIVGYQEVWRQDCCERKNVWRGAGKEKRIALGGEEVMVGVIGPRTPGGRRTTGSEPPDPVAPDPTSSINSGASSRVGHSGGGVGPGSGGGQ